MIITQELGPHTLIYKTNHINNAKRHTFNTFLYFALNLSKETITILR